MQLSTIRGSGEKPALSATVIVPVYRPRPLELKELIKRLYRQTPAPSQVMLIHTIDDSDWKDIFGSLPDRAACAAQAGIAAATKELALEKDETPRGQLPESVALIAALEREWPGLFALHIPAAAFDHAYTRDMAARMCGTDIAVFMTMDALPAHRGMLGKLCGSFAGNDTVWCAYARQLPRKKADVLERYTRRFNYPEKSRTARREDIKKLGVKAFFCSNACAAYRLDRYLALGGFAGPALFNEDMVFAGEVLENGGAVRYCAEARVYHSHHYTALQQFKRNFDLGISQACHPALFNRKGTASEAEGIRMIAAVAADLAKAGQFADIVRLLWVSAFKYAGYFLGKRFRKLPGFFVKHCSSNPGALFWREMENLK